MKTVLAICVGSMFVGMTAGQNRVGNSDIRERFAGPWRLVSQEHPGPDGTLRRLDSTGMFIFTRDGHLSVQVMARKPQAQTSAEPKQYSQSGYEASWGTYTVDERTNTFTFHVEGAFVRALIGKDLPRSYEFIGKQLVVRSARADEHWRVVWERY